MNEPEEKSTEKRLEQAQKEEAEILRREKVYHTKLMGLMIENIERERKKLKEKDNLNGSNIIEFMERVNNLKENVEESILKKELGSNNFQVNEKVKEIFIGLREDYIQAFPEDSAKVPWVSSPSQTSGILEEIKICLGQLKGLIYGKVSKFLK